MKVKSELKLASGLDLPLSFFFWSFFSIVESLDSDLWCKFLEMTHECCSVHCYTIGWAACLGQAWQSMMKQRRTSPREALLQGQRDIYNLWRKRCGVWLSWLSVLGFSYL